MAAIDVGVKSTVNSAEATARTHVNRDNPANDSGKITTVDIRCFNDSTGIKVAIFENVGGNNLTARDAQLIGNLAAGLHEGIVVDLDVVAGDYIGAYFATGNPAVQTTTGAGVWYKNGDQTECVNTTFTAWTSAPYLWGDGATTGWANKLNGVAGASIGKINGVAIADIAKVNGVA